MYSISQYLEPREGKDPGERPAVLDQDPYDNADANDDGAKVKLKDKEKLKEKGTMKTNIRRRFMFQKICVFSFVLVSNVLDSCKIN